VGTSSRIAELSSSCFGCPSQVVLGVATMGKRQPGSWASLASNDSDNDEEELAPVTLLATKSSSVAA
jgi:hypothetical protein